jgi:hypothetical protein
VVGIRGREDDVRGEETWPKKKKSKRAEIVGWSGTFLLSLGLEALSREGWVDVLGRASSRVICFSGAEKRLGWQIVGRRLENSLSSRQ